MREMPMMAANAYTSNTVDTKAILSQLGMMGQAIGQAWPQAPALHPSLSSAKEPPMAATQRRLIQVFIADPNENIPLDQCLIYSGTPQLTDLTDQELFFEIDVKTLLAKHNETRTKVVNKAVKERTEYLEAAKVRDLKMTVVTIAQF